MNDERRTIVNQHFEPERPANPWVALLWFLLFLLAAQAFVLGSILLWRYAL